MPPHHDGDINPRQGGIIQVGAGKGLRHKACGRRKTRRMVIAHQVVVYGLGDMNAAQRIAGLARFSAHDAYRIGRIVSANVEEVTDFVRLQDPEYFLAILCVGLVTRGAQGRGWRVGDHFQVVAGFLRQMHEVFIDDAAHPVAGTVYMLYATKTPRFKRHTNQ